MWHWPKLSYSIICSVWFPVAESSMLSLIPRNYYFHLAQLAKVWVLSSIVTISRYNIFIGTDTGSLGTSTNCHSRHGWLALPLKASHIPVSTSFGLDRALKELVWGSCAPPWRRPPLFYAMVANDFDALAPALRKVLEIFVRSRCHSPARQLCMTSSIPLLLVIIEIHGNVLTCQSIGQV
jgi:hypothetical protein